jgi:hypothetical protein
MKSLSFSFSSGLSKSFHKYFLLSSRLCRFTYCTISISQKFALNCQLLNEKYGNKIIRNRGSSPFRFNFAYYSTTKHCRIPGTISNNEKSLGDCLLTKHILNLSQNSSTIKNVNSLFPAISPSSSYQPHNLFDLFDFPLCFTVDEKELDQRYKQFQKVLHPDNYIASKTNDEVKIVTDLSSAVNQAYQVRCCGRFLFAF